MRKRSIATITSLALCLAVEMGLLYCITHHPAGGWGDPGEAFWTLVPYVLAPLGLSFAAAYRVFRHPEVRRQTWALFWVAAIGPISLWLALASHGHGMVLPMFLGFFIQSICSVVAFMPRGDSGS